MSSAWRHITRIALIPVTNACSQSLIECCKSLYNNTITSENQDFSVLIELRGLRIGDRVTDDMNSENQPEAEYFALDKRYLLKIDGLSLRPS